MYLLIIPIRNGFFSCPYFLIYHLIFRFNKWKTRAWTFRLRISGDYFCAFMLTLNYSLRVILITDFTLSNVRRFYSSKGDPLELKGLKNYLP